MMLDGETRMMALGIHLPLHLRSAHEDGSLLEVSIGRDNFDIAVEIV